MSHSRSLIAIGELGSFSKAAERLNLSPPAVFAQIHQFETELGEKLYERAGRKLVLTPAGQLMIDYCRRMLRVNDEAVAAVRELNGTHQGSVCLGCGPHISVAIVPHLLRTYISRFPNVELRLITGNDHVLFEELSAGRVNMLLMNLPVEGDDLVQQPLWRYEMAFVVPPDDPLGDRDTVSVMELQARPFILYQRAVVIDAAIRQFCVAAGFEPRIVIQNDQADSIRELVKLGMGISLLPLWSVSDDLRRGTLKIVRLDSRRLFSVTGLIYRRTSHLPKAAQSLLDVASEWKTWAPQAEDMLPLET
jgi:DNA-binding transcriptional LysR family regulator